ncbi:hypothetical protein EST38_g1605 [Candolleomyces aberdarensis]|uniref:Uncharacterized protein n=1 Tax=Candolleomyces aberdarensis TaxID=2316362 RepID=A0A4Q2DXN8_9AGAR|nr:hypothetical protein EST38_g1605 [Candolleomyces aberdarensis]
MSDAAETSTQPKEKSKNKAHRKDKPWDTDDIDHVCIQLTGFGELELNP